MLRNILSVSLVLILAGTGLNLATGTVQAAPHGGGHISGGFHGGFHAGSNFGGFHGGFHSPSFHSPGFHPSDRLGADHGASTHRFPIPNSRFDSRNWPAYGYSGPPYPYSSGLSSSWYSAGGGGSDEDYGQDSLNGPDNNFSPAGQPSMVPPNDTAEVTMTLPADATLWAMGQKTSSRGSSRDFISPPLEAGGHYTYHFRATWKENGHTVSQNQNVTVTPGAHVQVHFPVPENTHPAQSR